MKAFQSCLISTFAFCVTLQCTPSAQAEDSAKQGYDELRRDFSNVDVNAIASTHCEISQTLDYDKYRLGMGNIRDAWLYKDKPVEFYQRNAYQILYIVARKQATLLTQAIFLHKDATDCRFRLMISDQDKFGNDRPLVIVSWRFTRQLSDKTHWDKLNDKNFPKLALDWKWGQDFVTRASRESETVK